jgi:hypothetical protein
MKRKPDGFIITIITLVCLLGSIYYIAGSSFDNFENNKNLQARLERQKKLTSLMKKLDSLAKSNEGQSREPASISDKEKGPEFVIDSQLQADKISQIFYEEAKTRCYEPNKEIECLNTIDKIVTQFPDSVWAGESLLILSDFYYRTHRTAEAREVVYILKNEFKNVKSIQDKVTIVERAIK